MRTLPLSKPFVPAPRQGSDQNTNLHLGASVILATHDRAGELWDAYLDAGPSDRIPVLEELAETYWLLSEAAKVTNLEEVLGYVGDDWDAAFARTAVLVGTLAAWETMRQTGTPTRAPASTPGISTDVKVDRAWSDFWAADDPQSQIELLTGTLRTLTVRYAGAFAALPLAVAAEAIQHEGGRS